MANITKPVVEQHSCDMCGQLAENKLFWDFPTPMLIVEEHWREMSMRAKLYRTVQIVKIDLCESCANKIVQVERHKDYPPYAAEEGDWGKVLSTDWRADTTTLNLGESMAEW